jgi:hypothetical protein
MDYIPTQSTHHKVVKLIENKDNMCAARALVVLRAVEQKQKHIIDSKALKAIMDKRMEKQGDLARILCMEAKVEHTMPCGFTELQQFADSMKSQIVVLTESQKIVFTSKSDDDAPQYFLLHVGKHYHAILFSKRLSDAGFLHQILRIEAIRRPIVVHSALKWFHQHINAMYHDILSNR